MFRFGKKGPKASPETDWQPLMSDFFKSSEIELDHDQEKDYWLTYGLGYLSEYLKQAKTKDKVVADIEHQLLVIFGDYSEEEATRLRQRINRSTSSYEPLFQELIFKGLETYTASQTDGSCFTKNKTEVAEMILGGH